MIRYRLGRADAGILEKEFAPEVRAVDLVGLPNYHVYLKLVIAEKDIAAVQGGDHGNVRLSVPSGLIAIVSSAVSLVPLGDKIFGLYRIYQ